MSKISLEDQIAAINEEGWTIHDLHQNTKWEARLKFKGPVPTLYAIYGLGVADTPQEALAMAFLDGQARKMWRPVQREQVKKETTTDDLMGGLAL